MEQSQADAKYIVNHITPEEGDVLLINILGQVPRVELRAFRQFMSAELAKQAAVLGKQPPLSIAVNAPDGIEVTQLRRAEPTLMGVVGDKAFDGMCKALGARCG